MVDEIIRTQPETDDRSQITLGDYAFAVTKGLISSIPGGGVATELISLLSPAIFDRRTEWIKSIERRLRTLEERVEGFRVNSLRQNQLFITILLNATVVAIRNHQEEKLKALENAVLNTAVPTRLQEDKVLIFLRLIEDLTPTHVRMLDFLSDYDKWERQGVARQMAATQRVFPDIDQNRQFYKQIITDLVNHGLLKEKVISGDPVTALADGMRIFSSETTQLGNEFLKFISDPITQG